MCTTHKHTTVPFCRIFYIKSGFHHLGHAYARAFAEQPIGRPSLKWPLNDQRVRTQARYANAWKQRQEDVQKSSFLSEHLNMLKGHYRIFAKWLQKRTVSPSFDNTPVVLSGIEVNKGQYVRSDCIKPTMKTRAPHKYVLLSFCWLWLTYL